MTGELIPVRYELIPSSGVRLLPVPWRDPHTVSPAQLAEYIRLLKLACEQNPRSADLRTCLGMAYAIDYQVYNSEDALETAIQVEPDNFFAHLKYAELHFRLRALVRAEQETLRALDLATNSWELGLARRQLQEIRNLMREGTQKPEWNKPLQMPVFYLLALMIILCLAVYWK